MGISYDTVEDNAGWVDLMRFPFRLLSVDRSVGERFEVERSPDDRGFGLPKRITYLIDPDGVVARSYLVARDAIDDHPDEVLADLAQLGRRN